MFGSGKRPRLRRQIKRRLKTRNAGIHRPSTLGAKVTWLIRASWILERASTSIFDAARTEVSLSLSGGVFLYRKYESKLHYPRFRLGCIPSSIRQDKLNHSLHRRRNRPSCHDR